MSQDTPTPTQTRIPTETPTYPSRVIYLPIAVRNHCQVPEAGVDIALVIDASSSMDDPTSLGRSKIEAAREAAARLIAQVDLARHRIAIVTFNASAHVAQPLTGDRAALVSALAAIVTAEYTRIDLGIQLAQQELVSERNRADADRVMIVLTDGRNNPVPVESAVHRAMEAKAAGTRIFTIGLGDDAETDALRSIASRPEDYFLAPDAEQLSAIYETIAAVAVCGTE